MKKYAIVSYNLYYNFTNYGSVLQTYALQNVVNKICPRKIEGIVLDYCPDFLKDKDVLNPLKNVWDKDEETKKRIELSMPAIRENYRKIKEFCSKYYNVSSQKYTSENFDDSLKNEKLYGYICGSDTIWCTNEFNGFDDGYLGNYSSMKNSRTISYAASTGDSEYNSDEKKFFSDRMKNFKAISIRECEYLELVRNAVPEDILVSSVLDPTLLLTGADYSPIIEKRIIEEPYILIYSRRNNKSMEEYAQKLAHKLKCKIVEISLNAFNSDRNIMKYDAGVEEFLSLVKYAEHVITNSYHGMLFSIQMHTQFSVFSRELADKKIDEVLNMLNLQKCKINSSIEINNNIIDFDEVERSLEAKRKLSMDYLKKALEVNDLEYNNYGTL